MNKAIDVELDAVELERLEKFASINNLSKEDAIHLLIGQKLQQWANEIVDSPIGIFKH